MPSGLSQVVAEWVERILSLNSEIGDILSDD